MRINYSAETFTEKKHLCCSWNKSLHCNKELKILVGFEFNSDRLPNSLLTPCPLPLLSLFKEAPQEILEQCWVGSASPKPLFSCQIWYSPMQGCGAACSMTLDSSEHSPAPTFARFYWYFKILLCLLFIDISKSTCATLTRNATNLRLSHCMRYLPFTIDLATSDLFSVHQHTFTPV